MIFPNVSECLTTNKYKHKTTILCRRNFQTQQQII